MDPNGKSPEVELPSVAHQVVNLVGAALTHLAAGRTVAKDAQIAERRSLCAVCPHRTPENRCAACGCFLAIKERWASATCPIGRWPLIQVSAPNP